jgi:hypothetical protein
MQGRFYVSIIYNVLSPAQESFTYMEISPLLVEGRKLLAYPGMLVAQGLWAGRGLYRATPAVTRDFGFMRRTPFSYFFRHERGSWWPILTQTLTRPHSVASYNMQGDAEDLFLPRSLRN